MRTTITLDAEAQSLVEKAMKEQQRSFKEVVNEAIVRGLADGGRPRQFRTPTHSMGRARVDLTKALQLAGDLEDEELVRKMSMGK